MDKLTYKEALLLQKYRELNDSGKEFVFQFVDMVEIEHSKKIIQFKSRGKEKIVSTSETLGGDELYLMRGYRKLNLLGKEKMLNEIDAVQMNEEYTSSDTVLPIDYEGRVQDMKDNGIEKE